MKIVINKKCSTSTFIVIIIAIGFIVALLASSSLFSGIMSAASSSSDSSDSSDSDSSDSSDSDSSDSSDSDSSDSSNTDSSSTGADGDTDATTDDGGQQFSNVEGGDQMPLTPPMDTQSNTQGPQLGQQQPPPKPDSGTTATPTTPNLQQQQQPPPLTPFAPTDDRTVAGSGNANPPPGLEGLFSGVPPGSPPPFVTIPNKPEQTEQPTDTTSPKSTPPISQQEDQPVPPTSSDDNPKIVIDEPTKTVINTIKVPNGPTIIQYSDDTMEIKLPNGPTIIQYSDNSMEIKWPNSNKGIRESRDDITFEDGRGNALFNNLDPDDPSPYHLLKNSDGSYYVANWDGSKGLYDKNGKLLFSSPPSPPKAK